MNFDWRVRQAFQQFLKRLQAHLYHFVLCSTLLCSVLNTEEYKIKILINED